MELTIKQLPSVKIEVETVDEAVKFLHYFTLEKAREVKTKKNGRKKHLFTKTCEVCGRKCKGNIGLANHMRIHAHTEPKSDKRYACEICGKEFAGHSVLKAHMWSQHRNNE